MRKGHAKALQIGFKVAIHQMLLFWSLTALAWVA
jgi:hypothetical protein